MRAQLLDLTGSLARSFAFVGVAIDAPGGRECVANTRTDLLFDTRQMFRVASISKFVTGRVMQNVMEHHGIAPPYDVDVSDVLGYPLHPADPITLGMLATHTAGLADLVVPPDRALRDFLAATPKLYQDPPGRGFAYSNLGYVILAAALERMMDARFDHLAAKALRDLKVSGGFNWAGVAPQERACAMPTFRRDGTRYVAQIDGDVPPEGVIGADGAVLDTAHYVPGWNPAMFAPQGGLRTNLAGMLSLASALRDIEPTPLWQRGDGFCVDPSELMQDQGLGLQIFPKPAFYPRPLIGHFGNAYGFKGGIWYDRATDTAFAYALNGAAVGDESDALSPEEQRIFDIVEGL